MPAASDPKLLIGPGDMQVVEHVLGMGSGYVLDFSDRTFDQFIAHEIGIDATAPQYAVAGGSKAKRLRSILHSLAGGQQVKLLRALLKYRDSPVREERFGNLSEKLRQSYEQIIQGLEKRVEDADRHYAASAWTGRRTFKEQAEIVRSLAPVALREIDYLAAMIDNMRFNDPETADALQCLRELHRQLGELISAVDRGKLTREAVEAIEANRQEFFERLKAGTKFTVVAPTLTYGIMHVLSWMSGVAIDSTLVATVYGSVVGADVVKAMTKKSSLAK